MARERLAEHELRLGHRPLEGVDEDQGSVGHLESALDLATEIRVAGRVDQVDLDFAVLDRNVLGEDRDATLTLQVVGVQDTLALELRGPVLAGVAEHGVDQGSLAMVDVGNNGYVTDIIASVHRFSGCRHSGSRVRDFNRGPATKASFLAFRPKSTHNISQLHSRTRPLDHSYCTMEHTEITHFLGMLVVILATAKVVGVLAQKVGQPAVLGELIGGVLVGPSVLGWVDPHHQTLQQLSEMGVLILLFAIGLETDLSRLVQVGGTSMTVAIVGVAVPFLLGHVACRLLGMPDRVSIMAAATLTATSVGITARVLSDLGRLQDLEGQIILGAAVIDDILGLLILTIVAAPDQGHEVSVGRVLVTTASAFGFLLAALVAGKLVVPIVFRLARRIELPGTPTVLALIVAFGLAWLADRCGSAMIIGAFAAGLIVATIPQSHEIERGITALGHVFVPLFFVTVGASVDISSLDPTKPVSRFALLTGVALIAVGIVGKLVAGYAPFWFRGKKLVIGVGMVLRGEVGLIFARIGLDSGVFDAGLFGAVTLMVIVTTLVAPLCLKWLLAPSSAPDLGSSESEPIEDLVTEA